MRRQLIPLLILFSDLVSGFTFNIYDVETILYLDHAHTKAYLVIQNGANETTEGFTYFVNAPIYNVNVSSRGAELDFQVRGNTEIEIEYGFSLGPQEITIATIEYDTHGFTTRYEDRSRYAITYSFDNNVSRFSVMFKLLAGLKQCETKSGGPSSPSLFPEPNLMYTDGANIYYRWEWENLTINDKRTFWIDFEPATTVTQNGPGFSTGLFIGLLFGILLGFLFRQFLPLLRTKLIRIPRTILDSSEKRVLDIVRELGGEAYQTEVVKRSGLSKAKISKVLKELEKRGVIEREDLGKYKKIKLIAGFMK